MSIFSRKQSAEIDYDKLADAIVKAQQKADTQTIKNAIIEAKEEINLEKNPHTYSGELLNFLVTPLITMFTSAGICFIVGIIFLVAKYWNKFVSTTFEGVVVIMIASAFIIVTLVFIYVSWKSFQELRKTNDTQQISTVLSSLTSYMAMIVSIVALLITIKN